MLIFNPVPVIAIFTKMDALDDKAYNELLNNGASWEEAEEKVASVAQDIFERKYLRPLEQVKHQPRAVVKLRSMSLLVIMATFSIICHPDMDDPKTKCDQLLVATSRALNRETLRLFCLSILRNDVESRIQEVISK